MLDKSLNFCYNLNSFLLKRMVEYMPWKVIYFLIIVLLFGLFAGFNMKNTSDINLIFWKFQQIPIYISNLFSFLVGVVIILPFFIGSRKKLKKEKIKQTEQEVSGIKTVDLKGSKKKWFQSKKNKSKEPISPISETIPADDKKE